MPWSPTGPNLAAPNIPSKLEPEKTIKEIYQKRTQHHHILLQPDTYIGSVVKSKQSLWVFEGGKMGNKFEEECDTEAGKSGPQKKSTKKPRKNDGYERRTGNW
ncbi:DNA topoisomerase 2 [Striga asiatica]|uniref:DNA topoisomerase 2 n=1 Tax=Striga asiatica TaxID=4170 RepID=A0A5A7PE90_STRAF|nr:DNA topoisomerase 2 [Striga asiatica]